MNDDFLTRYRKSPPREFSEALYKRINVQMDTKKTLSMRRLTFAAALGMALIAALAFSPTARAAFNGLILEIGGITFFEPDETSSQATPLPESKVTIVPEEILSLAEAQAKLPFEISLPAWAPDGFVMGSSVRISYFGDKYTPAVITWYGSNPNVGNIDLMIGQRVSWLVETDDVHEVEVNGQPAALVGGSWDADKGTWNNQSHLTLSWMKGDVMYQLSSPGAPVEDLIRMAESIP
jgi:hypothetical protein